MFKIAVAKFLSGSTKVVIVMCLCFSLTACLGTVVGAVVDTTIEVVKIPFKVGAAVVDVVTKDDFTDEPFGSEKVSPDMVVPNRLIDEQAGIQ